MSTDGILRRLLPTGQAWRATIGTHLRKVLDGLEVSFARFNVFVDQAWQDQFPSTTRELTLWESELGVYREISVLDAVKRTEIAWRFSRSHGLSPKHLQDALREFGFDVYVHECWASTSPFVPRDPRIYTDQPLVGTTQCGEPDAQCGEPNAQCGALLANDPGYIHGARWLGEAPDYVPDDDAYWPYFIYIGGSSFGDIANIPLSQRREFEWLVCSLKRASHWVVLMVHYQPEDVFDSTFDVSFE